MPSTTCGRPSSRNTLPRPIRARGGSDGMLDPLPDQREQGQRHDEEEGAAPADIVAEQAAERRRNRSRYRIAGVQHGEAMRHGLFRQQSHDDQRSTSTRIRRSRRRAAPGRPSAPDRSGANATIMPDRMRRAEKAEITTLRSILRVRPAMKRLVITAKRPDIEIAWPAWPSV